MPTKIIPKISLVDFIKLIWAVIILYLALSFKITHVGENVLDLFKKDYLSWEDHQIYYVENPNIHEITSRPWYSQSDFDNLCDENKKICKKINFKSSYDSLRKTYYLSGAVYIIWWMDGYMVLGRSILKSFDIVSVQKEKSTKRARTKGDDVFVNTNTISYDWEFLQLLWHEFGHIIDLYSIKWLSAKKNKYFTEFEKSVFAIDDPSIEFYEISRDGEKIRSSWSKPEDFCSWYGMYDPFEDFAECNNLYLNHNAIFKLFAKANPILKNKYNFLASIYDWNYLNKDSKMLATIKQKIASWRPWDTTKIRN